MTNPETAGKPKDLLYRSHVEICRILELLAQENSQISARLKGGLTFASHLLAVDPKSGHLTIAYSTSKSINAMVLDSPTVEFTATTGNSLHFSFEVSAPEEALFQGQPAIQFALPRTLLLHNRREHPRIPVPADVSLRCVADEGGVIPFESRITDITHEGLGTLIYDPGIRLEDGTMLRGCRIILPGGDAVFADLQLIHASTVALPDGSLATRAGFRFPTEADDHAKVLRHFMEELEK